MLDINEKSIKSEKAEILTSIGANTKVNPKIKVMLMKQLPITFPSARSMKPFLTESTLVTSSGKLVPKATTVAPTITGGTPTFKAKKEADSIIKKDAATTPIIPNKVLIMYFYRSYFSAVSEICSTVSLFLESSYIL